MSDNVRVYLHRSVVAHELGPFDSPNYGDPFCVRCGRRPQWPEGWLGTGSMAEIERAAGLRLCTRTIGVPRRAHR